MEDKWKQKFRDKFDRFQPETVIPEFVPVIHNKNNLIWLPIATIAAAIVTIIICLQVYHGQNLMVGPIVNRMIVEPTAVLQEQPLTLPVRPISSPICKEALASTPLTEPIIPSTIVLNEDHTETIGHDYQQDTTQQTKQIESPIPFEFNETVSAKSGTRVTLQLKGAPFIGKTNDVHPFGKFAGVGKADTTYTYHLPLKASLSLCIPLTPSLSLESGISYRYHSATWIFRVDNSIEEQAVFRQHYVGIPLKFNYCLFKQKKTTVYTAIGEETFFRIHGIEDHYHYSNHWFTRQLEGYPLTCSLIAAVGLDFRLTPHISLYTEPGFYWQFLNTWDAPDYYQNHPVSLDLNIGMRLRL